MIELVINVCVFVYVFYRISSSSLAFKPLSDHCWCKRVHLPMTLWPTRYSRAAGQKSLSWGAMSWSPSDSKAKLQRVLMKVTWEVHQRCANPLTFQCVAARALVDALLTARSSGTVMPQRLSSSTSSYVSSHQVQMASTTRSATRHWTTALWEKLRKVLLPLSWRLIIFKSRPFDLWIASLPPAKLLYQNCCRACW